MRYLPATMLIVASLVAGCTDTSDSGDVYAEPAGGLAASSAIIGQDNSGSLTLVPDGNVSRPASCVTFQNGTRLAEERCQVRDGDPPYDAALAPWHLFVTWDGEPPRRSDDEVLGALAVVALDEADAVLADWDGRDEAAYRDDFVLSNE